MEIPPPIEAFLNTPVKEKPKSPNSLNINLATSETNIIISSHTSSDDCSSRVLVGVGLRSNAAIEVQQDIIYTAIVNIIYIMQENANAVIATPEVVVAEPQVNAQAEQVANEAKTTDDIIRELIVDGWSRLKGLTVKNVRVTTVTASTGSEYTRLCFLTQNAVIPRYMMNEGTGEFEKVFDNKVFTSLYSIIGTMREDVELSVVCNQLLENPLAITPLVAGGTIDVVYKEFAAGDTFTNPFATNAEETVFDHDTVITLIVGVTPGKIGQRLVDAGLNALGAKLFGL